MLTKDLFDQIVAALLPEMGDAQARKALIESALYDCPVLQKIQWDGAARPFTVQLARLLDQFGEIDPGRPAIVAVLEEVKGQVGSDRQKQVDALVLKLKAPGITPSTVIGQSSTPPEPEKPLVEISTPLERQLPPIASVTDVQPQATETSSSKVIRLTLNEAIRTPRWPRMQPFRPSILVMKGGGVKGIAYVGALETLEKYGYHFDHFVGTSAGAISAALLAVGYTPEELGKVLEKTDFRDFKDGWLPLSLPLLYLTKGLYSGENFRVWLENHLRAKFPQYDSAIPIRFKHLETATGNPRRLTVFASTKGRTAYAFDSKDPKDSEREISFACRCSMAIPYFFRPESVDGKRVVDGGMQNNYPLDALLKYFPDLKDSGNFIGLYLGTREAKRSSTWLLLDLFSIWSEAGDEEAKEVFIDRTIVIDPRPVKTTDFSLSSNDVKFLLAEGRYAALHWLNYWSDDKGKLRDEVAAAKRQSDDLRALVIAEQWGKFWPKLAIAILFSVLVLASAGFGVYYYFKL